MEARKLKVRCLGILQSLTGEAVVEIDWPQDNAIENVLNTLVARYPSIAKELPRCACAIGDELVPRNHRLQANDELVLLPPVGGG